MLERFKITRIHEDMPYHSFITSTENEVTELVKAYQARNPGDNYSVTKCV